MCLAVILFQCQEHDLVSPSQEVQPLSAELSSANAPLTYATGATFFVSPTGNDGSGSGSSSSPWKTLRHAVSRVAPNQGHTIQLAAGTYVESGVISIPPGINVNGAGRSATIIKAASSMYYNPANPGYATDRYLISLTSGGQENGNQSLSNFMVDGDNKKLHGGIFVRKRNNVLIQNVRVQYTNFNGIWLWEVNNSKMKAVALLNCSWGSNGWSSGALNLGAINKLEVDQLDVNESTGYGVKAIGPSGNNPITELKLHDSRVSVHPVGLWNAGSAPNIAIELWSVHLVRCEIYNSYVDNTISLVNSNPPAATGITSIRVHHNTLDMETRAKGAGYGVELTLNDAEIDHNYFLKGTNGIANWDNAVRNWSIHHNVFYGLAGTYPGEVVRSQRSGLHHVKLYNNTIEFAGTKTMNVIGLYGGSSDNIDVRNNLVINSNTSYSYYQNKFLHLEGGATNSAMTIHNNLLNNVNTSNLSVSTLLSCIVSSVLPSGAINKTGSKPDPYYLPTSGSSLVDRGVYVGFEFNGSAPDIGAYESGSPNVMPAVSLSAPAAGASFAAGTAINIAASATDANGSIAKVEFYQGSTKLGEDTSAPFSFSWSGAQVGSYNITARAIDNQGGATTSAARNITVTSGVGGATLIFDASQAGLSGKMVMGTDPQAGYYFHIPDGNGVNWTLPALSNAKVWYNLQSGGTYHVWARVKAVNGGGFHVYDGRGRWTTWNCGVQPEWKWVKVSQSGSPVAFNLTSGTNEIQFAFYEDNVLLDKFLITNNLSFVPN